ncbi:MAG: hypothetical protein AB7N91_10775 [Candidatus Tectimicrobiota bacterium]
MPWQSLPLLAMLTPSDTMPSPSAAWPGPTDWHRFEALGSEYLFVTDTSQVYGIDGTAFAQLLERLGPHLPAVDVLRTFGIPVPQSIGDHVPTPVPLRSLSLTVAQPCHSGCACGYTQPGGCDGPVQVMPRSVALTAVDRLCQEALPGERIQLAFLGGEPLLARDILRETTAYAAERARERGLAVGFALTSNGTQLTPDDGAFFEYYGFALTINLGGCGEASEPLYPSLNSCRSFETVLARIAPLLARQRTMQVSARVTVTPRHLDLPQTLDGLIRLGFHSVSFSPLLAPPREWRPAGTVESGRHAASDDHLRTGV